MSRALGMRSDQFRWDTQERRPLSSGDQEMKFVSRRTVETAVQGKGHQACCYRTIISTLGKKKQEDLEFKAHVGYTASSKLASARLHNTLP